MIVTRFHYPLSFSHINNISDLHVWHKILIAIATPIAEILNRVNKNVTAILV